MNPILDIDEVRALGARSQLIRIPDQLDVPVTNRIKQLIDTPGFRRLSRISQLGMVSMVYPAANHSRFEHSLGVYRTALLFLSQLAHDPRFVTNVSQQEATTFIAASLLHDIGHWPFCHPIEDIQPAGIPEHEHLAKDFICEGAVAKVLKTDWHVVPEDVARMLNGQNDTMGEKILSSMLSGPIDIDKMDYLYRDSLHAGVPYGRNFDAQRLIGSLCLNKAGDGIAITEKGKTAAELMVFARYVMFSEVYWHHTVRSATAMLQRAFHVVSNTVDVKQMLRMSEHEMIDYMVATGTDAIPWRLLDGLFGQTRRLHKRVAEYSCFSGQRLYEQFARKPYSWLVQCSDRLTETLNKHFSLKAMPGDFLIDAPPVSLEVEFNVDVFFPKEDKYRSLGRVSPVVKTLATHQFDDFVKRVRIFASPQIVKEIPEDVDISRLVQQAIDRTGQK